MKYLIQLNAFLYTIFAQLFMQHRKVQAHITESNFELRLVKLGSTYSVELRYQGMKEEAS